MNIMFILDIHDRVRRVLVLSCVLVLSLYLAIVLFYYHYVP